MVPVAGYTRGGQRVTFDRSAAMQALTVLLRLRLVAFSTTFQLSNRLDRSMHVVPEVTVNTVGRRLAVRPFFPVRAILDLSCRPLVALHAQALFVVLVLLCPELCNRSDIMTSVATGAGCCWRTGVRRPLSMGTLCHLFGNFVMAHSTRNRFEFLSVREFHSVEFHVAVDAAEISVNGG
jgi:hypothetical protein